MRACCEAVASHAASCGSVSAYVRSAACCEAVGRGRIMLAVRQDRETDRTHARGSAPRSRIEICVRPSETFFQKLELVQWCAVSL